MNTFIQTVDQPVKFNWEGSLFVHHSLGMVNRELLSELILDKRLDPGHIAYEPDQFLPGYSSKYQNLLKINNRKISGAAVHIKHRWPPDFSKPDAERFILMQPWEFGSLPQQWVDNINENVDEVWVYTSYLKMCYVQSGIPEEMVQVIPCGVDPLLFNPEIEPLQWVKEFSRGRFCFLFNGGTTVRKGIDILINAYLSEFKADEPVCLVVKDSNMYSKELAARIRELALRNDIASICYTEENIDYNRLPGLYTACDCYVHPYRAEGYGLPIAEAIACGKPAIVTGAGACLDFVEPDNAFFIKSTMEKIDEKNIGGLVTVDSPFGVVPDMKHLQEVMRYVFNHQQFAKELGLRAGQRIRSDHTWKHAARRAAERIIAVASGNTESVWQLAAAAENYLQVGDLENASVLYEKMIALFGDNETAYQGLATIAFQEKRYEEAFDLFRRTNLLMPDVSEILVKWYEVAKVLGRTDELAKPTRRALEICNNDYRLIQLAEELFRG
jgi:glycosyltransferase involved in cell wall biosynthesis